MHPMLGLSILTEMFGLGDLLFFGISLFAGYRLAIPDDRREDLQQRLFFSIQEKEAWLGRIRDTVDRVSRGA
jgi:hypothetical protein